MEVVNTILHPIFTIAVRDGLIRLNPASGVMNEIKRSNQWDIPKRHALTESQQSNFIEYIKGNAKYYHWLTLFTVLLGTGCRVGEIIGLRWQDCDFKENIITIDHSLIYRQQEDNSGCKFSISTPKTKAGIRIIPMFDAVKKALLDEYEKQSYIGYNETVIDGYSGFIFRNRYGTVLHPASINRAIERIVRDYNKEEAVKAVEEQRSPAPLPHFSVHNLRHTFCTRLCENEPNLKVIQEIMGHADITTTMDIYNEASKERKIASFSNLEGKIKLD
jgi:integrase